MSGTIQDMNRTRLIAAALASLSLALPASGSAAVIGTQDGLGATTAQLAQDAQLGSVARVLVNPAAPLWQYDERIAAREAAGMKVQLVLGGVYAGPAPTPEQAAAVVRRWPNAFAYSVVNEPENARSPYGSSWASHPSAYVRMFNRAYRAMKQAGAKRVLLGEWASSSLTDYLSGLRGRIVADGLAYHPYDRGNQGSVENTGRVYRLVHRLRARIHTPRGFALPLFWTEFGVRGPETWLKDAVERQPVQRFYEALAVAGKYHVAEVVFYGVHGPVAQWDTALFNADDSPRPVARAAGLR